MKGPFSLRRGGRRRKDCDSIRKTSVNVEVEAGVFGRSQQTTDPSWEIQKQFLSARKADQDGIESSG